MPDPDLNDHTDVNEDINTDLPESTAPMMNSQLHYEQSCFKSSARPMRDPDIDDHTNVNEDINTDLPESTAPMMNSQMDHKRSCFNHVNVDIDTDLPENSALMMNSDLIVSELDDAIRLEVLRNRTIENMSSHEFNDQLLSSEYVKLNTAEMFRWANGSGICTWTWRINLTRLTGCQCIKAEIRMIRRIRKSSILLCRKEWHSGRPRTVIWTAEKRGA